MTARPAGRAIQSRIPGIRIVWWATETVRTLYPFFLSFFFSLSAMGWWANAVFWDGLEWPRVQTRKEATRRKSK